MNDIRYLSVSALNAYLEYKFERDPNLVKVYLKAEVSNVRISKGIMYFVLKDSEAEIAALMYASTLSRLKFEVVDGMTVLVSGKVSLYKKRGTYSITVTSMEKEGIGDAYLNFKLLFEKLSKEGLFNPQYKKPIPKFNHRIGVITSSTGDAINDIRSTIRKRYPLSEIILYPAIVQGDDAPASLIKALMQANMDANCDVIIIARGGGSIEDLTCFNDEALARCIFSSSIPVISGVGHEADYTICDYVSDFRAPTPTGAAMVATPKTIDELVRDVQNLEDNLGDEINNLLENYRSVLNMITSSYGLSKFNESIEKRKLQIASLEKLIKSMSPKERINNYLNVINNDIKVLNKSIDNQLLISDHSLKQMVNKLIILNPLALMSKGYTVTYQNGTVISNINEISKDYKLETKISGGSIISTIDEIIKDDKNE